MKAPRKLLDFYDIWFLGNRQKREVGDFICFLPELFEVKAVVRPNVFWLVGVNTKY